jgi:hypothetical protein
MTTLLAVLAPIALMNSLLLLPRGLAGLAVALGSRQPILTASALIAGMFVPNLAFGSLVALGLDITFDQLGARASHLWQQRDALVIGLQFVIGLVMLVAAYRLSRLEPRPEEDMSPQGMTPIGTFSVSAGMTLMGLPSAVLYFAAIDQILRADLAAAGTLKALLFFNVICMTPLVLLVLSRGLLGTRSEALFRSATRLVARLGRPLVSVGLTGLGALLAADAIGWFVGLPLLPAYAG